MLSTVGDISGNTLAANYVFTFTIEPNADIAATTPSASAQFIAVNSDATVTFAEDMDAATVIAGNFSFEEIVAQGGAVVGAVAGSFSFDDPTKIITFDPTALLNAATWYRATVAAAVADQSGNPIGSNYTFEFKTEPTPSVLTTIPANTAQFVTVDSAATLTFSENMNLAATVTDDESVMTFYDGGTRVNAASIAYDSGTQKLIFTPNTVLDASTTYTVTILSTVADLTGNALGTNYQFTFTTEPNPAIAATTPATSAQFLPVNTDVNVTFAENMDETTVIGANFGLRELDGQGGGIVQTILGSFSYDDINNVLTFDPTNVLTAQTWYRATINSAVSDQTGNPLGTDFSFEFKTEPAPRVSTTIPANSAQFITVDATFTATFSENMNLTAGVTDDESVIKFYDDAGIPNRINAAGIAYDSGTQKLIFSPAAPLSASTTYTVTILSTVADLTGNAIGSNSVYTFTTEPNPAVVATSPSDTAQFILVGTNVTATFAEDMDAATVTAAKFSLERLVAQGGAVAASVPGTFSYNDVNNLITFDPTISLVADTWHRATIDGTVADQTGNPLGSNYAFEFKTEPNPIIAATAPSDTAQFIEVNANTAVTFAEDMDETTAIAANFSFEELDGQGGLVVGIVAGSFAYDDPNNLLTFDPTAILNASTWYRATVDAVVADQTGNPMGTDFVFEYKTEPNPTVVTTTPTNLAQFITVNSTIVTTFSEEMNLAATIADDETVITVYDDAATPNRITASGISYNSGTQQLTFTPAALLSANTTYTATILSTVTDNTGNPLAANYGFNFTTEPNTSIAATTPSDLTQFVLVGSDVTVTFSEDMDETTITFADFSLDKLTAQGGAALAAVGGTFSYNDASNLLTYDPSGILDANTWYRGIIDASVTDQTGNSLGSNYIFEFKTEPNPGIAATLPTNNAQSVAINTDVTITFAEGMNLPATIADNELTVTFYDDAATPNRVAAASIAYDSATMKLTMVPGTLLQPNTVYTFGGMHLTPVHATSGVLGLVHAHA